jgi:hypothetical protein
VRGDREPHGHRDDPDDCDSDDRPHTSQEEGVAFALLAMPLVHSSEIANAR